MANLNNLNYIVGFDAESIGLYGEHFALGYTVTDSQGHEIEQGYLACPSDKARGIQVSRDWINANVVPYLPGYNCEDPKSIYRKTREIFNKIQQTYNNVIFVGDCVYPVEQNLFTYINKEAATASLPQNMPIIHDTATAELLRDQGDCERIANESDKHNPLHDARHAARAFRLAAGKTNREGLRVLTDTNFVAFDAKADKKGCVKEVGWVVINVAGQVLEKGSYQLPRNYKNEPNPDEASKVMLNKFFSKWQEIVERYNKSSPNEPKREKTNPKICCVANKIFPTVAKAFIQSIQIDEEPRRYKGPFPLHELATAELLTGIHRQPKDRKSSCDANAVDIAHTFIACLKQAGRI